MANVKVAVRVRPLSKRCGGARRDGERGGPGGRWAAARGDRVPLVPAPATGRGSPLRGGLAGAEGGTAGRWGGTSR